MAVRESQASQSTPPTPQVMNEGSSQTVPAQHPVGQEKASQMQVPPSQIGEASKQSWAASMHSTQCPSPSQSGRLASFSSHCVPLVHPAHCSSMHTGSSTLWHWSWSVHSGGPPSPASGSTWASPPSGVTDASPASGT